MACSPAEHATRTLLVQAWLLWLFNGVIEPALKTYFYVTDTALYRNRLFYFRKPVWRKLEQLERSRIAVTGHFAPVTSLPAGKQADVRANALGTAVLRLLPKANSMRRLCNLSHKSTSTAGFPVKCCVC